MMQFAVVKRICRPLRLYVIFPDISYLLFLQKNDNSGVQLGRGCSRDNSGEGVHVVTTDSGRADR